MAQLRVHGSREKGAESRLPLLDQKLKLKEAVLVDPTSRGDFDLLDLDGVNDEDVVEVELQNGTVIWTRVDQLRADTQKVRQRGESDEILSSFFPLAGTDRSLVSWAIKSLKFFDVDVTKQTALSIAHRIESRLAGPEGIYRIDLNGDLTRDKIEPGSEEVLLFLHGTASSTNNAFRGLTRKPPPNSGLPDMTGKFKSLYEKYEGRVYGFEHKTLTESPAANALHLLKELPAANIPPLHLVSHSRGGLIGDLLAHGGIDAFPQSDLDAYGVPKNQLATYRELSELLLARAPAVERFVRIACPAAGTTLLSGRLDFYLSILVNLIGKVPAVGPFLEGFGDFVAAVAKERTDPDALPGLEAQMPTSALVRALNGSGRILKSDLTVIAGNSGGILKNLANLFYWTANDLVVDTRSMYGGARRVQRLWYCAEGAEVDHVSYFRHNETVDKLVQGLTREPGDTSGFSTIRPKGAARAVPEQPSDNPDKPCVIVLPGIMGSHLAVVEDGGRDRIWLDPKSIMFGGVEHLDVDQASNGEPDGLIGLAYADLIDYLRGPGGYHVVPFPYDWRLSIADAATKLDAIVAERTSVSIAPIRFVAHSMGGLVARAFIAQQPDRWQKLIHKHEARLVQLGTPNGGSFVVARILQGEEPIVRQLAVLDLAKSIDQWVQIIAKFPGLLEMVPRTGDPDFFDPATWQRLDGILTAPAAADLDAAKKTVDQLNAVDLSKHPVVYVAGQAAATPILADVETDALRLTTTPEGDGRVTWKSGIPEGVPTYYIPVEHGSMADDEDSFDGIRDLIESGQTSQFSRIPLKPVAARSRGLGPLAKAGEDIFPDQRALAIAALGMADDDEWQDIEREPEVPRTEVIVSHGDLAYAKHPVLIGHYSGDAIVNAEARLDHTLGKKLSERNQLELYPGAIGTAEVILGDGGRQSAQKKHAPGAIVVGLGAVGSLTPGALSKTVKAGLLRYVQEAIDRGEDTQELRVTSLLIGSGEAGLTMDQVVESILTGLDLANKRLRQIVKDDGERIATIAGLELLELYRDTALQALHAATRLSGQTFANITVKDTLQRLSGGRRRAFVYDAAGWWTRLAIKSEVDDPKGLTFQVYGGRARIEKLSLTVQQPLVDSIIADALRSSSAPRQGLPETLFELLLPAELKGHAADRQNLVLGIDDASARYPWEMLVDRSDPDPNRKPLSVVAGMLRQLEVKDPPAVAHSEQHRILVVGDPPSELPELTGAAIEAGAVADRFAKRGWDVVRQIRNDPDQRTINARSIVESLLTRDPLIVHLAGHGVYNAADPNKSGAVLGPHPDNPNELTLFTPALVKQMRLQPELVFINCCHLGRIEDTPAHLLAANLATGFIRAGVRAVVAAGWAVEDQAAEKFASVFYEEILRGATFGDAVRNARVRTHRDHPDGNTWAAYQCYGSPGYRLLADLDARTQVRGPKFQDLLDPCEVEVELDNLVSRLQASRKADDHSAEDGVRADLDALANVAQARGWNNDCGVAIAIARASGELKDFAGAIRWYDRARATDNGSVSLKDLEQYANFLARLGGELITQADVKGDKDLRLEGEAQIDRACDEINKVLAHGETAERLNILASARKRKIPVAPVRAGDKLLTTMTEAYSRAAKLDNKNINYPMTNALTGILLLNGPSDDLKIDCPFAAVEPFTTELQEARDRVNCIEVTDFWTAIADPDLRVIEALASGTLKTHAADIGNDYVRIVKTHGSPRELDSAIYQLEFLAAVIKNRKRRKYGLPKCRVVGTQVVAALEKLLQIVRR